MWCCCSSRDSEASSHGRVEDASQIRPHRKGNIKARIFALYTTKKSNVRGNNLNLNDSLENVTLWSHHPLPVGTLSQWSLSNEQLTNVGLTLVNDELTPDERVRRRDHQL